MHRSFKKSACISGVLAVALAGVSVTSYHVRSDDWRPGVAVSKRFHIAVSQGAFLGYSDMAFGGGTFWIAREGEADPVREFVVGFLGGFCIVVHSPSGTVWSLRIPFLYPIVLLAVPPLVWLYQPCRPTIRQSTSCLL